MKSLISFFFGVLLIASPAHADNENKNIELYINSLVSKGYQLVSDTKLTKEEKKIRSKELIRSNLYLDWMAHYTLGRYRRVLPEIKIQEFTETYSKFVVQAYAELFQYYNGEKLVVKSVRRVNDTMFIVNADILKPDSPSALKVEYLVYKFKERKENPYLLGDIITEGVSIINSQQAEFGSIISSQGIDALIQNLRRKIS